MEKREREPRARTHAVVRVRGTHADGSEMCPRADASNCNGCACPQAGTTVIEQGIHERRLVTSGVLDA